MSKTSPLWFISALLIIIIALVFEIRDRDVKINDLQSKLSEAIELRDSYIDAFSKLNQEKLKNKN